MKHLVLCAAGLGMTAALPGMPSLAASHPLPRACEQPLGTAVPDAETARKIAAVIIAARQATEQSRRYRLVIEPDGDSNGWRVWQAPASRSGTGGGGISLRVDRCTAAVSDFHYQR